MDSKLKNLDLKHEDLDLDLRGKDLDLDVGLIGEDLDLDYEDLTTTLAIVSANRGCSGSIRNLSHCRFV